MSQRFSFKGIPFIALFFVFTLSFCSVSNSYAQEPPPGRFGQVDDTETNIDAFYYLVEKGGATVQISAFGKIQNPGVYVIEAGSNLAYMLALSGGPTTSNQPDVKQITTVQLFRNTGNSRSLAYEATFDEVMDEASHSPMLHEGDIVIVDAEIKRKMNWRDVFTIMGPLLSTLLIIERLTN